MFPKLRHCKRKQEGVPPFDYICSNKLRGSTALCDIQNLNGKSADAFLLNQFFHRLKETKHLIALLINLKSNYIQTSSSNMSNKLKSRLSQYDAEINNLLNYLAGANLSRPMLEQIDQKIQFLTQKKEETQKELRLLALTSSSVDSEKILKMAESLLPFSNAFSFLSLAEQRKFFSDISGKIYWNGSRFFFCSKMCIRDSSRPADTNVNNCVGLRHAMKGAGHKWIVIRSITEYHQLGAA